MNTTFNRLVATSPCVSFNMNWKNTTGYLDNAAQGEYAPKLALGECVTSLDDFGRSVVIIGVENNTNIVMFQRHSGNKEDGAIVCNEPRGFTSGFEEAFPDASIHSRMKESDVKAVCDYVASNLLPRTSSDWDERARHLNSWSVA